MLIKMSEAVELFPLSVADYDALVRYLVSFPGETRDSAFWRDRFRLWWEANPAFSEGMERGWILKEDGAIVGFIGNIPSYFQWGGEKKIIYNTTTWRVSPSYRNHSLRLLFKQLEYGRGSLLFLTTAGKVVRKISQTFRLQFIQRGVERTGLFVIHPQKILEAFFGQIKVGRFLAKGLAPFLEGAQALRLKAFSQGEEFQAKELARADSSFDELWKKTRGRIPNTTVRTAEVINWYCVGSSYFEKKLFGVYRGPSLLAYMIFMPSQVKGLNILECIDFWGETRETAAVKSLFHYLKDWGREHSIDLIRFPSFSKEVGRLLGKSCLLEIPTKRSREYFKTDLGPGEPISPENTYFPYAVGDFGL